LINKRFKPASTGTDHQQISLASEKGAREGKGKNERQERQNENDKTNEAAKGFAIRLQSAV
jgi:hypothetical protein